jgi:hypothetical protein
MVKRVRKIMMILALILQALASRGFGQTKVCLIYVESSATSRLSLLKTKVQELVEQYSGQQVILYISNGKFPVIGTDSSSIRNALGRLNFMKPPKPDFFQDVDSMNTILSKTYFSEELDEPSTKQVKLPISFCFFLNCQQAKFYEEEKKIVAQLLQSNRLSLGKRASWQPHRVQLHLDALECAGKELYVKKLETNIIYEVQAY